MLSDVFGFFLTPEASLDPNSGCDRLQYLILNYLVESPEYGALRHRTAANNLASLAATEEFGNRFLEYIGRAQIAERANEHGGLDPAAPVPIEKIIFADYAVTADGDSSNAVLLILAKHVEGTVESTRLLADVCHTWGIEPGAMRATPWADRAALVGVRRRRQEPRHRRRLRLQKRQQHRADFLLPGGRGMCAVAFELAARPGQAVAARVNCLRGHPGAQTGTSQARTKRATLANHIRELGNRHNDA